MQISFSGFCSFRFQFDLVFIRRDVCLCDLDLALDAFDLAVDAVFVDFQAAQSCPVRVSLRVRADDADRAHGYMVVRVFKPCVIFFALFGACPPAASAASALDRVRDDLCQIRPVVCQRHPHNFRLMHLVLVVQRRDSLRDLRSEFRQRDPARLSQLQPVHALACRVRQFQSVHVDRDRRLRVHRQPFPRPPLQLFHAVDAGIRFDLAHHSVQVRVLFHVVARNVQIVLADRIEPCVHPASVDRLCDRPQVPSGPHLAADLRAFARDVQPEWIDAHVVAPPGVLQTVAHRFQAVKQAVPVEFVRVSHTFIVESAQHPVALPCQDVAHRLPRRAGFRIRVSGDLRRLVLSEQHHIPQRLDRVFQLHRRCPCRECLRDAFHPPYDPGSRLRVILHPAVHADPCHVRRRQRRRAVPFLQLQAQRFHRDLPLRRQAVTA